MSNVYLIYNVSILCMCYLNAAEDGGIIILFLTNLYPEFGRKEDNVDNY